MRRRASGASMDVLNGKVNPAVLVFGNGKVPGTPGCIEPLLPPQFLAGTHGFVGFFCAADPTMKESEQRNIASIFEKDDQDGGDLKTVEQVSDVALTQFKGALDSTASAMPTIMVVAGPVVKKKQLMTMTIATEEEEFGTKEGVDGPAPVLLDRRVSCALRLRYNGRSIVGFEPLVGPGGSGAIDLKPRQCW